MTKKTIIITIFCIVILLLLIPKILAKNIEVQIVDNNYNNGTTINIKSNSEIKSLKLYKKTNDKYVLFYIGMPKTQEFKYTIKNHLLSTENETEIRAVVENEESIENESIIINKIKPRVSMKPEETAKPTSTSTPIPTKPNPSQNNNEENNNQNKDNNSNNNNNQENNNDNSDQENNKDNPEQKNGIDISLSESNIEIQEGKTYELVATVNPEDAEIEWYVTDSSIVKIIKKENNIATIKALKKGKTNVFVTNKHKMANCDITVIEPEAELEEAETAIGMNGGVRVQWKKVENAKSYKIIVQDYNGKKHEVSVPNNVTGEKAHDYDVYKTNIGNMIYWNVKKLDHNYNKINTWMNKNNVIYKFKVEAYNGKNLISQTDWMKARPYNVEKDGPEQNIMLPNINSGSDPEKGREGVTLATSDNKTKLINKQRMNITKINESDGKIYIEWKNEIPNFNPQKYIIQYKHYYSNNETKNTKIKFNIINIYADENITSYTIEDLKNEAEYLVQVIAVGTDENNDKIYIQDEQIGVPHTKNTRTALLNKVNQNRCDPYNERHNLTGYFNRNEAEAFANYGRNGKAFPSKTNYFLWTNMHQVRLYIFRKDISNEWRLWKDMPVGICQHYTRSPYRPAGEFNVLGREWNVNGGSVKYGVNYENASFGNIFHSVGVGSEHIKMINRERFCTAGCTSVDLPWIKWIYDYGISSYVFNDYGTKYK